jgi:hypothetical protein
VLIPWPTIPLLVYNLIDFDWTTGPWLVRINSSTVSAICLSDLTSFLHRYFHLGRQLGCIFDYCLDPVLIGSQSSSSPSCAPTEYIWQSLSVECIWDRCLPPLNLCFKCDLHRLDEVHRLMLMEPNHFQYIDSIIVSDIAAPSCWLIAYLKCPRVPVPSLVELWLLAHSLDCLFRNPTLALLSCIDL